MRVYQFRHPGARARIMVSASPRTVKGNGAPAANHGQRRKASRARRVGKESKATASPRNRGPKATDGLSRTPPLALPAWPGKRGGRRGCRVHVTKSRVLPPTVKPCPRKDGTGAANPTAGSGVAWGPDMRAVGDLGPGYEPRPFPGPLAHSRRSRPARTEPGVCPNPVQAPYRANEPAFVAAGCPTANPAPGPLRCGATAPQSFPPNASLWYTVSAPLGDLS